MLNGLTRITVGPSLSFGQGTEAVVRWHTGRRQSRQQEFLALSPMLLPGGGTVIEVNQTPFVKRVPWDADLRDEFTREYSSATAAAEIDSISRHAVGLDPYKLTRQLITEHIRGDVLQEEPGGDIRAVAVYAQPDRFDREWAITRTFPFFHRTTRVEPGRLREVSDVLPTDVQRLAKLVVTRLVVPDDGRDDAEVLQKTVELISRDDIAKRRADFQAAIAKFHATGLRDETIVGEIEDLLAAFNASVKSRTNAQRSRAALQFATAAVGAAAHYGRRRSRRPPALLPLSEKRLSNGAGTRRPRPG